MTRDTLYELKNDTINKNQYVYCENNPAIYVDSSGHFRIPRFVAAIAFDTIALAIAGWAPASWLAFTAPIKTMGKVVAEAWMKTTFRSGALRFLSVISRVAAKYKGGAFALKVATTAALTNFITIMAGNIDMVTSLGAFAAGLWDYCSDKKLDGWITI